MSLRVDIPIDSSIQPVSLEIPLYRRVLNSVEPCLDLKQSSEDLIGTDFPLDVFASTLLRLTNGPVFEWTSQYINNANDEPNAKCLKHVRLLESLSCSALKRTVEDILSDVYILMDQDVTRHVIDILSQLVDTTGASLPKNPAQLEHAKEEAVTRLMGLVDSRHDYIIGELVENSKEILVKLLEEFVSKNSDYADIIKEIDDIDSKSMMHNESTNMPYGTMVKFKGLKQRKGFNTPEIRWLAAMYKRYKALTEEISLDTIFNMPLSQKLTLLPRNVEVHQFKDHVRFDVPAPTYHNDKSKRICIKSQLPQWTHSAFTPYTHLNPIQSAVFDTAFNTSQNMLICAPTGGGKTIIGLLVMLRCIAMQIDSNNVLNLDFKIIYIAPMKALVQEMVAHFTQRLSGFALNVRELTGDMSLTVREIAETHVIITTPEKWDVVTRKNSEHSLVQKAKLIVIDEVHLLNDERGPVIEAIVSRTLRYSEINPTFNARLVGLSATLPNCKDVAKFLHVDLSQGLKIFGPEYRPVPLEQSFIAVKPCTDSSPDTDHHLQANSALQAQCATKAKWNEEDVIDALTYREVISHLKGGHQIIVFVHSRKQTVALGQYFQEQMTKCANDAKLFRANPVATDALNRAMRLKCKELYPLFQSGICCHHAGLVRSDRNIVERLFKESHFAVLICTATLAWGVNLPCHTVIIRGTKVYSAQHGKFMPLSVLDVMQIFGRAGRPQFDTSGHGIIVSSSSHVQQYLRYISHALPIESRLQSKIEDHLNAEIQSGTVTSVAEGVRWLEYTYLWQRIKVNPLMYGFKISNVRKDPDLITERYNIISRAACNLNQACMIRYNAVTGVLDTTDLGRVASHYYISCNSILTFDTMLRDKDGDFLHRLNLSQAIDIVTSASEFTQLKVRAEEHEQLVKLQGRLPALVKSKVAPVGECGNESTVQWKIAILLKAYISRLHVDYPSLQLDLVYVIQNINRITRGLLEIELQRAHPCLFYTFLTLSKCIDCCAWPCHHPIRQFRGDLISDTVVTQLELKRPSMETLRDMTAREIGQLIRYQKQGEVVKRLAMQFPFIDIKAELQPLTSKVLRLKIIVTPHFQWCHRQHAGFEKFWLIIVDDEYRSVLYHDHATFRKVDVLQENPAVIYATIPIRASQPSYSIQAYSDRWIDAQGEFNFNLSHLNLPDDAEESTKLLPLQPLSLYVLPQEYRKVFKYSQFNSVQSQVFHTLYHTDYNVFLGAPTGSGKTGCAEIAVVKALHSDPGSKVVYIAPLKALVKERITDWTEKFTNTVGKKVIELTGDVTPDIHSLLRADIICTTPEKWDGVSRHWEARSYVRQCRLVIFDEIHMLASERGPIIEALVSRMRYIGWRQDRAIRLIGLSTAVASASDMAQWLGVEQKVGLFNFGPKVRPVPMRVHIAGYPGRHYCPRMAAMNKPVYTAIVEKSPTRSVLIFVSSRRQTRLTALALISHLVQDGQPGKFARGGAEAEAVGIADPHLRHCLGFGVGIHHAGLADADRRAVEGRFRAGLLQVLVATSTLAWGVNLPAHLVVVKGTEYYDAARRAYVDYPPRRGAPDGGQGRPPPVRHRGHRPGPLPRGPQGLLPKIPLRALPRRVLPPPPPPRPPLRRNHRGRGPNTPGRSGLHHLDLLLQATR